jgi:hypothetical protein
MRHSSIKVNSGTITDTIIARSSKEYEKYTNKDIERLTFKDTFEDGIKLYAGVNSYFYVYVIPESSPLFNFYLVSNSLQSIEREGFSKFIRDARKMVIDMTT